MRSGRRGSQWLLIALIVALLFAMIYTMLGLSLGTIRSRHGVQGALESPPRVMQAV